LPGLPRRAYAFGGDAAPFNRTARPCLTCGGITHWLAAQAAVGAGASRLTETGRKAIVTAIVRAENNHNNRPRF
jgi:hypothetical protein